MITKVRLQSFLVIKITFSFGEGKKAKIDILKHLIVTNVKSLTHTNTYTNKSGKQVTLRS